MGLLRGMARTAVVAGTATAVSNRVSRRQAARWDQQEQEQYTATQAAQPAPSTEDQYAQLEKLGQLRQQGVLTDAEFANAKRQILGI